MNMLLGVMLFFVIAMIIFAGVIYNATGKTLKTQMGNQCKAIAVSVAVLLEQDIDGYKEFSNTLDMSSKYYKKIKDVLADVKDGCKENITFIYTEKRISETESIMVLDSDDEDAPTFAVPGEIGTLSGTRLEAYEKMEPVVGTLEQQKWGIMISAYAPIYDKEAGEFLGLVGVDISKDQYNGLMRYQLIIIVGSLSALLLAVAIAVYTSSEAMEKAFIRDGLTNIYNRRFFDGELKYQIKEAKKTGTPLSVFMMDIDHFKVVNDTYGHAFGDQVLKAVTQSAASVLRKADCLARYGGEEFVVSLPGANVSRSMVVAERLREVVEHTKIYNSEHDEHISVTISIGVTQHSSGQTAQQILMNADKALYDAKKSRNAVALFE